MMLWNAPWLIALPIGRWGATQFRASGLFYVGVLASVAALGLARGCAVMLVAMLGVALQAGVQALAARWCGAWPSSFLLWPLGTTPMLAPGASRHAGWIAAAAGAVVHLVACAACVASGNWTLTWERLADPFAGALRRWTEAGDLTADVALELTFAVHWCQLVFNLSPIYPADGIRLVGLFGPGRRPLNPSNEATILSRGAAMAMFASLWGVYCQSAGLAFTAAVVWAWNWDRLIRRSYAWSFDDVIPPQPPAEDSANPPEKPSESFDSLGKTSLDLPKSGRSQPTESTPLSIDDLLDKVYKSGLGSLTSTERAVLDRASEEFRSRARRKA